MRRDAVLHTFLDPTFELPTKLLRISGLVTLRQNTITGVFWSAVQNGGSAALGMIVFVTLVRLVDPESIGLITTATIVILVSDILARQGLAQALVQRPQLDSQ